jgi:putative FmdB family regulatory protein
MPLYEFTCVPCDRTLTITANYDEIQGLTCPNCGQILKRSYSFGAVRFKGSGFYATDKGKQ